MGDQVDILHPLATLHWKEYSELPEGWIFCALQGQLYVGNRATSLLHFSSIANLCTWTALTTPTTKYALTTYHSKLVLAGGVESSTTTITNKLWTGDAEGNWQTSLPPMLTKRHSSLAINIEDTECLIVVGGIGEEGEFMDTVEVLVQEQWSAVQQPLPKKEIYVKLCLHNGYLYVEGGFGSLSPTIFYCKVESLLNANPGTLWYQMTDEPSLTNFRLTSLIGQLISIGASINVHASSRIFAYSTITKNWIYVGDLPVPLYDIYSVVLPTGELMVTGRYNKYIRRTFKACLKMSSFDLDSRFSMSALCRLEEAGIHVVQSLEKIHTQLKMRAKINPSGQAQQLLTYSKPEECVEILIDQWESGRSHYPPNWRCFLDVLKELKLEELSHEIEDYFYGHTQDYLAAYHQIIATQGSLDMYFLKFIFVGPPRMGKTSLLRRLIGEIVDIISAAESSEQPSTGTVESARMVIRNLSSTTAVMTPGNWSSIKGLSEEARMLLQFFYQTNSLIASEPVESTTISHLPKIVEVPSRSDSVDVSSLEESDKTKEMSMVEDESHKVEAQDEASVGHDEMSDIDYAIGIYDMLMKAMASNDWKQVKYTLEYTALINIEDTGGQPEFMDMLPALVMGPSLYFIFCRLIDDLKSHYTVSYLSPSSGESTVPMESTYTVEEVILQALSAVACARLSPDDSKVSSAAKNLQPSSNSVAFIVGTHRDLVTDEQIAKFDAELKEAITSTAFYKEGLVEPASKDRLVLAVNNKDGGIVEVKKIRKFLEERILHHFKKIPIPASWLIFSLCLRNRVQRTASLQDCLSLAQQLGMPPEETRVALWFLHHHAGVLMYFPEVPELEDLIVSDVQIIFDSVTNMIVNTFKFGKVTAAAQDRFRKTGQFSLKDVRSALKYQEKRDSLLDFVPVKDIITALWEYFPLWKLGKSSQEREDDIKYVEVEDLQRALSQVEKEHIPLDQLIKLLEHLNIIARIHQSEQSPSSSLLSSQVTHLMPCILKSATSEELNDVCPRHGSHTLLPAPLMIRYECGFVPIGIFPALIARLVGQSWPLGKEWMLDNTLIRKNKVTFIVKPNYDRVTLISCPRFYEVVVEEAYHKANQMHYFCISILQTIRSTLDIVTSRMNTAFSRSYELSFECPSHPGKDHLCVVSDVPNPKFMLCLLVKKCCPLEPKHAVWFQEDHQTDVPFDQLDAKTATTVAAQCKVFMKMLPKLVTGIKASISTVCDECLSRSLISEDLYESLLQLNASDADKARRVLLNVKQVIALREEKFQEFVEVLREVGGCVDLAEELNKALNP